MNTQGDPYLRNWSLFFLFVGLGGALGGWAHGFNYDFPEVRHTFLHKIAWTVGGIGLYFGELASIGLLRSEKWRSILRIVVTIKLIAYIVLLYYSQIMEMGSFNHFDIVRFNSAGTLLGVILPVQIFSYLKLKNPGAIYALIGILALFGTVFVYNNKINLHAWMDFNDISHVIEMFTLIMLYIGVVKGYPYKQQLEAGEVSLS